MKEKNFFDLDNIELKLCFKMYKTMIDFSARVIMGNKECRRLLHGYTKPKTHEEFDVFLQEVAMYITLNDYGKKVYAEDSKSDVFMQDVAFYGEQVIAMLNIKTQEVA